jgi:hypothetical protein
MVFFVVVFVAVHLLLFAPLGVQAANFLTCSDSYFLQLCSSTSGREIAPDARYLSVQGQIRRLKKGSVEACVRNQRDPYSGWVVVQRCCRTRTRRQSCGGKRGVCKPLRCILLEWREKRRLRYPEKNLLGGQARGSRCRMSSEGLWAKRWSSRSGLRGPLC